jgi:hypothetical protein
MDTDSILSELKAERDRLDQAIAILESATGSGRRRKSYFRRYNRMLRDKRTALGNGRRGRGGVGDGGGRKPKHRMSAAARKRISEAAKARWAKAKKAGKNSL